MHDTRFRIGHTIKRYPSVSSTNTVALRYVNDGAPHGTVIVSDIQTAGRGRDGRIWESPPGGLWMSVILKGFSGPEHAPGVSLMAGLATRNAAATTGNMSDDQPVIKWPNDVYMDAGKLAGVLVEGVNRADEYAYVVGIGMNVCNSPAALSEEVRARAVSLAEYADCPVTPANVLPEILSELNRLYDAYAANGLAVLLPEIRRWSLLNDKRVVIETAASTVRGTVAGIADDGALLVEDASGGAIRVVSGDVIAFSGA